jgi:hypothetical protein
MAIKETANTIHDLSQPVVLGLGGAVFLGVSIDDLLKIGTLTLLLLNIPLASFRIYRFFKPKDEK